MNQTNELMHFKTTFCEGELKAAGEKLGAHAQPLCAQLAEIWREFCTRAEPARPVAYLEISLLRCSLLHERSPELMFECFDEYGMFGERLFERRINLAAFSETWGELARKVLRESKRYMGKIPVFLAEETLLELACGIEKTLAELLARKSGIWLVPGLDALPYTSPFQCSVGAYRYFQHIVFER